MKLYEVNLVFCALNLKIFVFLLHASTHAHTHNLIAVEELKLHLYIGTVIIKG